jgi:hypothetical protein
VQRALATALSALLLHGCAATESARDFVVAKMRAPDPGDLHVEASWNPPERTALCPQCIYGLFFHITNRSRWTRETAPVGFWRLAIEVVDAKTGRVIERGPWHSLVDPSLRSERLAPQGSVERGELLSDGYPDLWRMDPDESVLIYWSLEVLDGNWDPVERVRGVLEVKPGVSR